MKLPVTVLCKWILLQLLRPLRVWLMRARFQNLLLAFGCHMPNALKILCPISKLALLFLSASAFWQDLLQLPATAKIRQTLPEANLYLFSTLLFEVLLMSYQPTNRTKLSKPASNIQSHYTLKPRSHSLSFPTDSPHTRQEFKQECDINTLMSRYMKTGEMPHINLLTPQYFDAPGVDFHTHMNVVAEAKSMFARLPSEIRTKFKNDPGQFIDFCSDPANRVELAHMGLLSREATRSILNPDPPTATVTAKPTQRPAPPETPPQSPAAPEGGA